MFAAVSLGVHCTHIYVQSDRAVSPCERVQVDVTCPGLDL